ncbi:MAG: LAGLIDADG family homing endonuclease [Kosmotogaceae bacterium]
MMNIKLTDKDKMSIIKMFNTGNYSYADLSRKFNVSSPTIRELIVRRKKGINKGNLTDKQKVELCELYKTGRYSTNDLAKLYNTSQANIQRLLKNRNIKPLKSNSEWSRKYNLNENYFDKIDSEDKAYFLGLLYADGCNYYEKGNSISINLQEEDKYILDKFRKLINTDKPLYYKKPRKENHKGLYSLYINSEHISFKLIKLGMWSAKAHTLKFPTNNQVPKKLIKHFIRGYFDGDGSVESKWRSSLMSSKYFCTTLQDYLFKNYQIISKLKKRFPDQIDSSVSLIFEGKLESNKFLNLIYKDATIYLERKYNKYINNLNDKSKRGKIGEEHPNHKLTWKQVHAIRKEYRKNVITQRELGKKYHITQWEISNIINYKNWV